MSVRSRRALERETRIFAAAFVLTSFVAFVLTGCTAGTVAAPTGSQDAGAPVVTPVVADMATPVVTPRPTVGDMTAPHVIIPPALPDLALPAPGGASRCSSAGALFCDSLDGPIDGELRLASTTVYDNGQVFRGQAAMHVTAPPGGVGFLQTLPLPDVYLRAWVYIPSPLPTNSFTFLSIQAANSDSSSIELGLAGGHFRVIARRSLISTPSTVSPPLDQWFCVQWQIHESAQGYTDLWVNNHSVSGISPATLFDTTSAPQYNALLPGLGPYDSVGSALAKELWIDELVMDDKPVDCVE